MLFCSPLIDLLCCFIVLANQRIHLFVVVNLPRSLVVANTMSVIPSLIRRFIYHMFACLPRIVWLHLLRCTFRRRSHLYHFRLVLVSWRFTKIPSTEIGYGSSLLSTIFLPFYRFCPHEVVAFNRFGGFSHSIIAHISLARCCCGYISSFQLGIRN